MTHVPLKIHRRQVNLTCKNILKKIHFQIIFIFQLHYNLVFFMLTPNANANVYPHLSTFKHTARVKELKKKNLFWNNLNLNMNVKSPMWALDSTIYIWGKQNKNKKHRWINDEGSAGHQGLSQRPQLPTKEPSVGCRRFAPLQKPHCPVQGLRYPILA